MKQVTLHGEVVAVGDRVWNNRQGWELVRCINPKGVYPIETDTSTFEEDGFRVIGDKKPSLFWKEQKYDLSKSLPDLKVDDKVIVWNIEGIEANRHFCKFKSNGDLVAYNEGKTSWTSTGGVTAWKHWRLPDDLHS